MKIKLNLHFLKMCGTFLNSSKKITSTLALIIIPSVIFSSCGLMIYLFASGQVTQALSVFSALIGIASGVSGYYFGSKASEKGVSAMVKTNNKVLDSKEREITELREISRGIMMNERNRPNDHILNMNEI
jgi:ABC-type multidrug transport system permease subunit